MRINYKGTNIVLSDEMKEYFEKRILGLKKIIDFDNPTLFLAVELGKTTNHHQHGDVFRAEVNLEVDGQMYRAVSEREDLYTAIDEVKDELTLELTKQKGRRMSLIRRGGQKLKGLLKGFYRR